MVMQGKGDNNNNNITSTYRKHTNSIFQILFCHIIYWY